MPNQFVKGRTNNHLVWVMVDATDAFTPESALSAATKIKIFGKLRGATGVNFVSSGTGSLTNDIQHVGASVNGIYTIALAKADLSDASAAWYDTYIINLSAPGAAYQTLVVDGGIDQSTLLSRTLVIASTASDAASAAIQGNSRVLVAQSGASDAASAAAQANSRILLVQSRLSDFDSRLVSDVSDIRSMLSDMQSDFQSRVPKRVATDSQLSDLASDLRSVLIVNQSVMSDTYSLLSDHHSDFQSRVPKLVATNSQLSDLASDIKSAVAGVTATVGASDISDIASAVWAHAIGARVDSRVLVAQSFLSDIRSQVSDLSSDLASDLKSFIGAGVPLDASTMSDLRSAVAAVTVNLTASDISDIASAVLAGAGATVLSASDMSDIASRVWAMAPATALTSRVLVILSDTSNIYSLLSDVQSDFQSRVPKRVATDSQLSDLASDVKSVALLILSNVSDVQSVLSDLQSDFQSRVPKRVATDSQLSDMASDIKSAVVVVQSLASDAASAAQQANSRVLVNKSTISDVYSLLSDLQSDFQSRVPKAVATNSQLSDLASDVKSAVAVANTNAAAAASRALLIQSTASDIYSLLSDVSSDIGVMSGVQSDIYSLLQAGITANIGASDMSDLRSAITANGVLRAGADPTATIGVTDTLAAKVDWMAALSRNRVTQTATQQTLYNDANAQVASAAVSDDGTTYDRGEWAG